MKIKVSEIPDDGLNLTGEEKLQPEGESGCIGLKFDLRIEKLTTNVFISGLLDVYYELQCSRCLKDFKQANELPVKLVYLPVKEIQAGGEFKLAAEDMSTGFYQEDVINVSEMAREQAVLGYPMKPLCTAECRGICPSCGADLNTITCGCVVKRVDPRLKVLDNYFKKEKE